MARMVCRLFAACDEPRVGLTVAIESLVGAGHPREQLGWRQRLAAELLIGSRQLSENCPCAKTVDFFQWRLRQFDSLGRYEIDGRGRLTKFDHARGGNQSREAQRGVYGFVVDWFTRRRRPRRTTLCC